MNTHTSPLPHDGQVHTSGYLREVGPGPFKEINDSYVPPAAPAVPEPGMDESLRMRLRGFNFAQADLGFLEAHVWRHWLQHRSYADIVRTVLSDLAMSPHLVLTYEPNVQINRVYNHRRIEEAYRFSTDQILGTGADEHEHMPLIVHVSNSPYQQDALAFPTPPEPLTVQSVIDTLQRYKESHAGVKLGLTGQTDLAFLLFKLREILVRIRPDEIKSWVSSNGADLHIGLRIGQEAQDAKDRDFTHVCQTNIAIYLSAPPA